MSIQTIFDKLDTEELMLIYRGGIANYLISAEIQSRWPPWAKYIYDQIQCNICFGTDDDLEEIYEIINKAVEDDATKAAKEY